MGVRVPPALQDVLIEKNEEVREWKGRTMTESVETTEEKLGLFARVGLFYRQILSELKKVVWPTRKQLSTYTAVVLVFVMFIIAVVSLLDLVLTKIVFWVFG